MAAIVVAAGYLAAYYAVQATQWSVMTDELQTAKLATSVAQTLSPAPRIHGEYYGALNQLYPILISPFFGLLSVPQAVTAAHATNAFLLANSAVPAYLLARAVTSSRAGGYFAASLTAFVPWLVLSSTLLTENLAYPAFVWAVFLGHRGLVEPSAGRDAGALAGLVLAFLARTQLVVLALAYLVALLGHELGFAAATADPGRKLAATGDAARRMLVRHRLLLVAYAVAAAVAAGLAAAGELGRAVGNYAGVFRGDLLPAGIWHAAAVHLDYVVVGVGVAPFLLAAAWSLGAVWRPGGREAHAFAALLLVLVPLLTLEAASFDLRFTPGGFVQDRYLCYLAPLLAVGAAAALLEPRHRLLRAGLVLAAGAGFGWLAALASYGDPTVYWAAPAASFHRWLTSGASGIGISTAAFVAGGSAILGAALAVALWRAPPRVALAVVGLAVSSFGATEAAYVFDRVALPETTRAQAVERVRRDWVDARLPGGSSVALVPNPALSPEHWWDAELWNETVDRALSVDGGTTFTPFPATRLSLDPETGEIRGDEPGSLLLLAADEVRFGLVGAERLARAGPLGLVSVARPYRAAWLTRGLEPDGWALPGKPVQIRLFGASRRARRDVVVTLSAFGETSGPQRFTLTSSSTVRRGRLAAGTFRRVRFTACAPARGFASATLVTRGAARLPDGRVVGLHVDRIRARATRRACR